ncbi:hypothetical protein D9M73_262500 [compost metagenome]
MPAEVIVEVDYPAFQIVPGKQPGLGFAIGLHGAVVIQVVAGQVRHHGHIECQRGDTALVQTVGRDLHGNRLGPGFFQVAQGRLHCNRVGRGVQAAFQRAMKTTAKGADNAAVLA